MSAVANWEHEPPQGEMPLFDYSDEPAANGFELDGRSEIEVAFDYFEDLALAPAHAAGGTSEDGDLGARLAQFLESEQAKDGTSSQAPLDWTTLHGKEPPPRLWVLPDWIPAAHTTLLAGRGGIGKSLLAQHLATAVAAGIDYMGPTPARRVLLWAGEDDHRELWYRQTNICSYLGVPMSSLTGKFFLVSYMGADMTLAAPIFGALQPTARLEELRAQVNDYSADLVIIDNIARCYGGSENDRHAVTTFIAWVQGACAPAAVLLLGHPAKSAGSEFSGSTAWEGAVRARLYLSDRPPDAKMDDEDSPIDDRVRYLSRRKANYSALDLRRLTLTDGVLIPDALELDRIAKPSGEFLQDIVRRAVTTLAARNLHGVAGSGSPNYLPRLAKQYGLLDTATERAFATAMRQMILAGTLKTDVIGRYANRAPRQGLVLP